MPGAAAARGRAAESEAHRRESRAATAADTRAGMMMNHSSIHATDEQSHHAVGRPAEDSGSGFGSSGHGETPDSLRDKLGSRAGVTPVRAG